MKVGIISKGSPDYLIDIVCDGVIRLLGRSNVALDYNHGARWGGQYSILMGGVEQPNAFDIHDADLLIASDRSIVAMEAWMKSTGKKKVALIDGEDDPPLRYDPESVTVYFKREYFIGVKHPSRVRPLPFGAIPETLPKELPIEKPVFYLGHESNPIRGEIVRALRSKKYDLPKDRLEKEAYNQMLMSSLVGISARGCGWDTYRYWEIPYFGTALLSQRMAIMIPDNFVPGEEAEFFVSTGEMIRKLAKMIANPEKTMQIAAAGRRACMAKHLSIHRAKSVLDALA